MAQLNSVSYYADAILAQAGPSSRSTPEALVARHLAAAQIQRESHGPASRFSGAQCNDCE